MRKYLLPALLAAALAVSCQQLFTASLASPLARDSISVPDKITEDQASDLIDAAMQGDDPDLTEDVLKAVNDLIASGDVEGDALTELITDAGALAVDSSGISDALAVVLDNLGDLTGDSGQEIPAATQDEIYEAIAEVGLTDAAAEALMNMADLPAGSVEPDQLAFAGMALVLDAAGGADLSTLSDAEWTALEADPEYVAGMALINAGAAQAEAVEEGSSDMMTMLQEFLQQEATP